MVAECQSHFGGLNILVNNAGIAIMCDVFEMSLEDWQRQQAINLDGVFLGVTALRAGNERHGRGWFRDQHLIGSRFTGCPGFVGLQRHQGRGAVVYQGCRSRVRRNGWPVRVNSVHPGIIATPIWDKIDPTLAADGANTYDPDEMSETAVPHRRIRASLDIANGVLFLASDESSYMTGSELVIDGGLSC